MKIRGAVALGLTILIFQHLTPELFGAGEESGIVLFRTFTKVLRASEVSALGSIGSVGKIQVPEARF